MKSVKLFGYVGHEYFHLKLFRQFCHLNIHEMLTFKESVKKHIQYSDFLRIVYTVCVFVSWVNKTFFNTFNQDTFNLKYF